MAAAGDGGKGEAAKEVQLFMDVEREDGEPVGLTVDDKLVVVSVAKGSMAEDAKMQKGDQVNSVNGLPVGSKDQFFQRLRFAHPRLRLGYKRVGVAEAGAGAGAGAPQSAPQPAAQTPQPGPPSGAEIPGDMEKLLRRRPGFSYKVVELDWPAQQERQLGIVLTTRMHRVIVGGLKPGSLGAEKLQPLDRMVAVNGAPVSDKDVAKTMIVAAGGKFQALVERPESEEARKEHMARAETPPTQASGPGTAQGQGQAAGLGDPSILPHDCLQITLKEREQRTKEPKAPLAGILRKPPPAGLRVSSKISHAPEAGVTHITRDVPESKRLRRTPLLFAGKN